MATERSELDLRLQVDWAKLFDPHHDLRRQPLDPKLSVTRGIERVVLRPIVDPRELVGACGGVGESLEVLLRVKFFDARRLRRIEELPGVAAAHEAFSRASPDFLAGQLWANLIMCIATEADEYLTCWRAGNFPLGYDERGRLILVCAPPLSL